MQLSAIFCTTPSERPSGASELVQIKAAATAQIYMFIVVPKQRRSAITNWRQAAKVAVIASITVAGILATGSPAFAEALPCKQQLTLKNVERAIALGTSFMKHAQRRNGAFHYEYDWRSRSDSSNDHAVRQAGAAWGIAALNRELKGNGLKQPTQLALDFFKKRSREGTKGARWVTYPGDRYGSLGAVALNSLAHIEWQRSRPDAPSRKVLDGYLRQLIRALRPDGLFHSHYRLSDGTPKGDPSPYYDGEALLALVKAAKYLGRADLLPTVLAAADAGHAVHVKAALKADSNSNETKGYYQWSSMVYYELASWPAATRVVSDGRYKRWLIALAEWMIDTHKVLRRSRNTGYAFEGIVPAYAIAAHAGDPRAERFACAIEQGVGKLMTWQLGSASANRYVAKFDGQDKRALGGVQNHKRESGLRIDVTQHQMHAMLLVRDLYLPSRDPN